MTELAAFEALAAQVDMVLPEFFCKLLATGLTLYEEDWGTTWRERMLLKPPALICCFDFEWITSSNAKAIMADWLNPDFQGGLKFLPFAKSGAGDAYCLMSLHAEQLGVAMIQHDASSNQICYASFIDFVNAQLLETLADLTHLLDDFSEQEALQSVQADITQIAAQMDVAHAERLLVLSQLKPEYRPYQDGPRCKPRMAWSLISQSTLDTEFEKLTPVDCASFSVKARWEVSMSKPKP